MNYFWFWKDALIASVVLSLIVIAIGMLTRLPLRRKLLWSALAGYLVLVFFLTALPIVVTGNSLSWREIWNGAVKTPVRPILQSAGIALRHLSSGSYGPLKRFLLNTVGNLALLTPFAFFIRMLSGIRYRHVLLLCVAASLFIEGSQAALNKFCGVNNRIVDINDIILNVAGSLLCCLVMRQLTGIKERRAHHGDVSHTGRAPHSK
ncbi:MAG: VanZ family protein [Fastidiosipilaceae bacterium]